MSVIIRLQGLPWSASAMNIRHFFTGLNIPAGGVHIIGGDGGDAFIAFSSDDDARVAMKKNMCCLNDNPIQLFLSSKAEMQSVIDAARSGVPSQAVPSAQQAGPGVTSDASPAMTNAAQGGMQRPNFPPNMAMAGMDAHNKNTMQQSSGSGNDFGSHMQPNQWQGFHGGNGAGDGTNQPRQNPMMGQQHGMGSYPDGGDNQFGNRGYNKQGMGMGGTMMDHQGRNMAFDAMMGGQANIHNQGQRVGNVNQGQGSIEGKNMNQSIDFQQSMNQQGPMGYGNINQPGAFQNQGFPNQFNNMGGPRPMGLNQSEMRGRTQGNIPGSAPFNQNASMEQSQGVLGSAGRQGTGGDIFPMVMNQPNLTDNRDPDSRTGMNMPPVSMPSVDRMGNQFQGEPGAVRDFDKGRAGMQWGKNPMQGPPMNRNQFPGNMNFDRSKESMQNPNIISSHDAMSRPPPGPGSMHGSNQGIGMPPNQFTDKMEEESMPSTSYPPDEPSIDPEGETRMQTRFPPMHSYNRDGNLSGEKKMGIDKKEFSEHNREFGLDGLPARTLPGGENRMFPDGRGPGFEGRGPVLEGKVPGFEGRGPGFQGRGPGLEGTGPGFEGRGPGFEGRGPGFEGRGPGFDGRGPGFEGRGPGFEGRGPGFEGRGPGFEGRGPGFEGRGPGFEGRGPEFEGRGPRFEGRGRGFEGRRPGFDGNDSGFEGRGPGFEGRAEMGPENRRPGLEQFEGIDMEGRDIPGMEPQGRQEFERRMRFEGRLGRPGFEERVGPSFEGRESRFEGPGPNFEGRRGPGFEGMHEMDVDRRENPDFDGREELEANRMRGAGYGRGVPGMRGRGSDMMRGRGVPGQDLSRGRGFSDEPFNRDRSLHGDSEMEDFDNRIPGRGGPMFDRPFRGRGDPFFRGRGGPPGPFGRGRGMDRFEDAGPRDVDARDVRGHSDFSQAPPHVRSQQENAAQDEISNQERGASNKDVDDDRRRDHSRSNSASRRDVDSRGVRRSNDRDRESDRDRRNEDRRGRDRDDRRDDRRYEDRSRYRFSRYRRSRSRSRDRSRDKDRYSSSGKSGSPRVRDDARTRTVCVKNMPLSANYREIRRFFQPYDIPFDGLKIINDEKGQRTGVAYVQFRRSDDIPKALRRNGEKMESNSVTVTSSTDEEFSKAVDSYVPSTDKSTVDVSEIKLPSGQAKDKPVNPDKMRYILQLKNLPVTITKQDILQFFKGVTIENNGQSAYIEYDLTGVATGMGFVEVKADIDYKKGLTFDGSKIGVNAIRVLPGTAAEADDLKGKQIEMLQRAALRNISGPKAMGPGALVTRPGLMGPRLGLPPPPAPSSNQVRPQAPGSVPNPRPPTDQTLPVQQNAGQIPPSSSAPVKPVVPATTQPQQPPQVSSPVKSTSQEDTQKNLDTVCVHIQGLPLLATPQDIRQFFNESQIALRGINIAHDDRGKPLGEGFVEFRGRADFDKALKKDKTSLGRHIVAVKPISKKEMQGRLGFSHKTSESTPSKAEEVKKDQIGGPALLATPITGNQNNGGQQQRPSPALDDPQSQNGAQRMSQPQQRPKPLMFNMPPCKSPELPPAPAPPTNKGIPPGVLNQNWFYVRCQNFPPDITISEILHFFQGFRPLGHSIRLHYSSDGKPTGNAVVGFAYREEADRALGNLNMKRCRQNIITLYPA
ncbi:hypothetical protein EGW08_006263 [Elysia chlorotica]|uniref:RRM domain-containing protein n=1 Tax=Elysia chlorotica TaxID=188477 RepID=A0A3S1HTS1_ELYCH|nr:hypothetical protein EGW08_006263 [Elysia chlorotica]